ncbi:CNP1-like family protein [Formivibrio citricus]|uniref:CNP1-like family protein n=1 Tax=Formivibrio citricus TaxID=83765 RepID=A0A1I4ZI41_9NEIS|nr:CNP1-like family protein [Formivibrio citricus]SFN49932.1 CNP1-like family protein [Formivibrio citricus]
MLPRRLVCLTLFLATGLACAANKEESDVSSWIKRDKENAPPPPEQEFTLPDLAKLKEWRAYKIGKNMGENRVEIAADSVTVGKDDILRYAVAIVTKSGVRNVFFEGLDCYSGRYRNYAWGTAEQTWKNTEGVRWKVADLGVRNAWQGELIKDFCSFNGGSYPAKTIVDVLRGGELPQKFK